MQPRSGLGCSISVISLQKLKTFLEQPKYNHHPRFPCPPPPAPLQHHVMPYQQQQQQHGRWYVDEVVPQKWCPTSEPSENSALDPRSLEDLSGNVDTTQLPPNLFNNANNHDSNSGNRVVNNGGPPPMGQPGPPQGVANSGKNKGAMMGPMGGPPQPHEQSMSLAPPTKMSPSPHPQDINPSANGSAGRKYQCKMCPQIFMHKSAMQHHSREAHRGDIKPYQCQQCLKSFSSNHQLLQHIRIHTGEKPYKCSYCDRRFKQLSHVQQHTRLHTGERPYKCPVPECNRAFIQLSNLQQHLRNHDSQMERAKNRPYVCNTCGKCFATDSSLRTHGSKVCLQQHVALVCNPFTQVCPLCHKSFINSEAVLEHMHMMHKDITSQHHPPQHQQPPPQQPQPQQGMSSKRRTSSISHLCPLCGKSYVNEGSLRKHVAGHQNPPEHHPPSAGIPCPPLRMWPCTVCQNVFTQEAGLLHHMEAMRTDPRHQFAAQYLLSRAAAERRLKDPNEQQHMTSSSASGVPSSTAAEPLHLQQPPPQQQHSADVSLQQQQQQQQQSCNSNSNNPNIIANMPPQLQPQQLQGPQQELASNCTTSDSETDATSPPQVNNNTDNGLPPQQHYQNLLH